MKKYSSHKPFLNTRNRVRESTGYTRFFEASEHDMVRKFLYRDMVRNHKIPVSKARIIVDTLFRVHDTLISAFKVRNSLLTFTMSRINNFIDKLQNVILRRQDNSEEN